MKAKSLVLVCSALLLSFKLLSPAKSEERKQPLHLDDIGAAYEWIHSFKNADGVNLSLYAFYPDDHKQGDSRTAVIFIHGGGWKSGHPSFFFPHCQYFSKRGTVAFSVQYRLVTMKGIDGIRQVQNCIADCKSAVRYIRANKVKFGIDPDRMVVSGDSSGGHLAAALGLIDRFDDPHDNVSISSKPQACICFNPVLDLNYDLIYQNIFSMNSITEAARKKARIVSPITYVVTGAPPMLIMHGTADKVVPVEQATQFTSAMKQAGNRCEVILLENAPHAFAINWAGTEETIVRSLREMEMFMHSLGLVDGEPTIEVSQ